MNCVNQAKFVLSSMVLSCLTLLPAGAQVYNFDTSSFEPSSLTGSNTPATVAAAPAIPAPEDTYSLPPVPPPVPVMPWDKTPNPTGTFGNGSNQTSLNAIQNGQRLSNMATYDVNPLAIQTAKQSINLPQATQGLLAPGTAGGMASFSSGQYNFGFSGGAGAYINAGLKSFKYGSILPPTSTGSVDFDITE